MPLSAPTVSPYYPWDQINIPNTPPPSYPSPPDPPSLADLCRPHRPSLPLPRGALVTGHPGKLTRSLDILPALYHAGAWTSGYANIVRYMAARGVCDIDHDLTASQRADTLAYASYLGSRGAALLAFSLYVSPSAWAALTRPAYSQLLRFPLTWTVPLKLRAAAIAKTEHLGLDHLAADVDPEDGSSESKATTAPLTATGFLRLPAKPSVSDSMAPEQAAAIRLQSVTEDFFLVLDDLRGQGRYFLGRDKPSSLDFHVFGYLRLLKVRTPHPFMENCMRRSRPGSNLANFLEMMHAETVRWQKDEPHQHLPWVDHAAQGVVGMAARFTDGVVENTPGLGATWKRQRGDGVRHSEEQPADSLGALLTVGAAAAGAAAVGGALLFRALSPFGASLHHWDAPRPQLGGLYQFGSVGAMFEGLPGLDAPAKPSQAVRDTVHRDGVVEVAVDANP